MAAVQPRESQRGQALAPFVGQYVGITMRRTDPAPADDADEEDRAPKMFIGVLARFSTTTITLVGAVNVHPTSKRIIPFSSSAVATVSPVYLTANFKSLSRVSKCSPATLYTLFRDPVRRECPAAPTPEEESAAVQFLIRVLFRRYVFTEMRDKVQAPADADDSNEDEAPDFGHDGAEAGEGSRLQRAEQQVAEAVTDAVGGAPPTSRDALSAIRMPLMESVNTASTSISRAAKPRGKRAQSSPRAGPSSTDDSSAFATLLTYAVQAAGNVSVQDAREALNEECVELRQLYAPRQVSPTTRLHQVISDFVKTCFLYMIVMSVFFCILGGVTIGTAISGPLTSGGLSASFAGYMWYLLILPGVLSAVHGVSLSAKGESAAMPSSRAPTMWLMVEVGIILLLSPGFVFACMFVHDGSTPRITHSTAEEFWSSLASLDDSRICDFQETEHCSGFHAPCYVAGNRTTVFVYARPDCAVGCRMSTKFLLNLPSDTCGSIFTAPVKRVSDQTIGFFCVFLILVALRLMGLKLIRDFYTRRAMVVHMNLVVRHQAMVDRQRQEQDAHNAANAGDDGAAGDGNNDGTGAAAPATNDPYS